MKTCAFCKAENADEAKFCVICGKDLSKKPVMKYMVRVFLVVAVVIGIIIIVNILDNRDRERRRQMKEEENISLSNWDKKIQLIKWNMSGETMYFDIHNGSEHLIKEILPTLHVYEKGTRNNCDDSDKNVDSIDSFQFKLELEKDDFLKPLSSGSYSIHAGAVLTSEKYASCKALSINYKGSIGETKGW